MNSFHAGELWERVRQTTGNALQSGHLLRIKTESRMVADGDVDFLVRIVDRPERNERNERKPLPSTGGTASNPFLPCDPHLFVADVSDTHVAILNKYMVVDHHLLIITRDYVCQDEAIRFADFDALSRCLFEYNSFAFYNSGTTAGASQRHRHLQLIPLPLDFRFPIAPIENKLQPQQAPAGRVLSCDKLPFTHRWWRFAEDEVDSADAFADASSEAYASLIAALGWTEIGDATPYNLLVTRQWMMLVPRREECFAGISLNAMAFLGALLVRDETQLQALRDAGPITALVQTAGFLSS